MSYSILLHWDLFHYVFAKKCRGLDALLTFYCSNYCYYCLQSLWSAFYSSSFFLHNQLVLNSPYIAAIF